MPWRKSFRKNKKMNDSSTEETEGLRLLGGCHALRGGKGCRAEA
jgi:hypothetical protein